MTLTATRWRSGVLSDRKCARQLLTFRVRGSPALRRPDVLARRTPHARVAIGRPGPRRRGPATKDPPPKAGNSLVGEWQAEKVLIGGQDFTPKGKGENPRFSFGEDGKLTVTEGDKKPETGTYKVDAKADPPRVDLIPGAGSKDPTLYGVYKVDGDTLTIAVADKESDRPTKLEPSKEAKAMVLVFKRAKK